MSNLSIPYARHPRRGNITPDDTQDGVGALANVTCLGCEERLVHRNASYDGRRRTHYAHLPDSQGGVGCLESAIHARAKDLLASASGWRIPLPSWHSVITTIEVASGSVERTIGNRRVDVLWRNEEGQRLAIEVSYTNPKYSDFARDMRQFGIPAIELTVTGDDAYVRVRQLLDRVQQSKWLIEPTEPFYSEQPPYTDITERLKEKVKDSHRKAAIRHRKAIIAQLVGSMERNPNSTPQFRTWYLDGSGKYIYATALNRIFANAIILTEIGFEQRDPEQPCLFRYPIAQDQWKQPVHLYADLDESGGVLIYLEDVGDGNLSWFQAYDVRCSELEEAENLQWIRPYFISAAAERLREFGVAAKTSQYDIIDRRKQDPARHVDESMLSRLVREAREARRELQKTRNALRQ